MQKEKKKSTFAVSDIESTKWINFLCIGHYDGIEYRYFLDLDSYFDYVFSLKNKNIFCHFGGIFDFLHLISHILDNPEKYKLTNMIPRGSSMLSFRCYSIKHEKYLTYNDSSALFQFGLKNLAIQFDVETKKGEMVHKNVTKVTKKLLDYMKDDCLALYQVIDKFRNWELIKKHGMKNTLASQSLHIFQNEFIKNKLQSLPMELDDFCRKSYYGGRTEIFNMKYDDFKKDLNLYDINSLYPYVMSKMDIPVEFVHTVLKDEYDSKKLGIWHVKISCPIDKKIPILGTNINGKFIFPIGEFDGYWCSNELNFALKRGYKIIKVYEGKIFFNGGKIFKYYVEYFYKKRLDAKSPAEKYIIKLLMNSLYGRMGMDLEKESLDLEKRIVGEKYHSEVKTPNGHKFRFFTMTKTIDSFTNVSIASFITAEARIELYKRFEEVDFDVYNCDTDSIFTTKLMKTSNDLGGVKLENKINRAVFLLPKTYMLEGIDFKKLAMKGFDKQLIGNIQFDDFVNHLSGEIATTKLKIKIAPKMLRLKSAMKKGKILAMSESQTKQIRSQYNKRKINSDHTTIPWHYNELIFDFINEFDKLLEIELNKRLK